MKAPCMGCNKRTATCHAECAEYKAYKGRVEEVRKARDFEREFNSAENERRIDCRKRRVGFRPT